MSNSNIGQGDLIPQVQIAPPGGTVIPFDFEGQAVRVIVVDGEIAFVGKDVAERLGYADPTNAMKRHCKGVVKRHPLQTEGGVQEVRVISEPDVFRLIIGSKLPSAQQFERLVFEEILPAIRKTGGYMVAAPEETAEELALRAMGVLQATVERQKAQIAAIQPKADALDRIAAADGSHAITDSAKVLGVRPKDLFAWLSMNGWIYRRPGGDHWLGYQARVLSGDLHHKVTTVLRPDGTEKTVEQVKITPQGLTKLAKLLPGGARQVGGTQ